MNKKNRQLKTVIDVLNSIGVTDFLILGARKTGECAKKGEMEAFYCRSGSNEKILAASLYNIFERNDELTEILVSIIHEVAHEKVRMVGIIGPYQEATA